jgi:hypothetical protein
MEMHLPRTSMARGRKFLHAAELLVYMRRLVIGIGSGGVSAPLNGGKTLCAVNDDIAQPRVKRDRGCDEAGAITPQLPSIQENMASPLSYHVQMLVAWAPDTHLLLLLA